MLLYVSFPPGHEFSGLRPESSPIFLQEASHVKIVLSGMYCSHLSICALS
jgi:hypothetical protein